MSVVAKFEVSSVERVQRGSRREGECGRITRVCCFFTRLDVIEWSESVPSIAMFAQEPAFGKRVDGGAEEIKRLRLRSTRVGRNDKEGEGREGEGKVSSGQRKGQITLWSEMVKGG